MMIPYGGTVFDLTVSPYRDRSLPDLRGPTSICAISAMCWRMFPTRSAEIEISEGPEAYAREAEKHLTSG
jgi:hypothetical protein